MSAPKINTLQIGEAGHLFQSEAGHLFRFDVRERPRYLIIQMLIGLLVLLFLSADRRLWGWPIVVTWGAGVALVYCLMAGGIFGLKGVGEDLWADCP